MRFRLRPALVALLCGASACFIFNRGKPDPRPAFDVPAGEIALNVTNHNYLDVVVYVLHDGQQTRVGMVTGSSAALLFVPIRLLGMGHELQLYGRAIGNDTSKPICAARAWGCSEGRYFLPGGPPIVEPELAPPISPNAAVVATRPVIPTPTSSALRRFDSCRT